MPTRGSSGSSHGTFGYGQNRNSEQFVAQQAIAREGDSTIWAFRPSREGAALYVTEITKSATISNASGNSIEVFELLDLDGLHNAIESNEDNYYPIFDKVRANMFIYSNKNFILTPAIVLMENGESFATTEYTTTNPYFAISSNITGVNHINMLKEIIPRGSYLNQTLSYGYSIEIDLTKVMNDYAKHANRSQIDEDSTLELRLVAALRSKDDGQGVSIEGYCSIAYHLKPVQISDINFP